MIALLDFGVFVAGVVADDGADRFALRHSLLGRFENADEIPIPVTLHASCRRGR